MTGSDEEKLKNRKIYHDEYQEKIQTYKGKKKVEFIFIGQKAAKKI